MNTALILEPDVARRCRLIRLLGRHGWAVRAVVGIADAVAQLDQPAARLVFINEAVDDDAGYLLLFALREHARWRHARIVMMGKGDERRHGVCAAELGADDYMSFPFTNERVWAGLLRFHRPRRANVVATEANRPLARLTA